jgi:long-chain fatty acid transport protein
MGARAVSMGTAFTGLADDPSTIYFNPAGLAFLEDDFSLMAGWAHAMPEHSYTPPMQTEVTSKKPANLPYGFLTYKARDLTFGVGGYVVYGGGGVDWKEEDLGQGLDAYLAVLSVSPTVAWKLGDRAAVGASAVYYYGLNKATQSESGQVAELDESGKVLGFSLGVLLKPSDVFSVGMSLVTPGKVRLEGTTTIADEGFPLLDGTYDSYTEINLPADASVGIAVKPVSSFTFTADFAFTAWSALQEMQGEVLDIPVFDEFGQPVIDPQTGEQMLVNQDKSIHMGFGDIARFKFGAEYILPFGAAFRAGYIREHAASSLATLSPFNIDVDRNVFFLGLGYKVGRLNVSVLGMKAMGIEREVPMDLPSPYITPGTYNIDATVGSIEFYYSL